MPREQLVELVKLAAPPAAGNRAALRVRLNAIVPANSRYPVEAVARFLEILHEQPIDDDRLPIRLPGSHRGMRGCWRRSVPCGSPIRRCRRCTRLPRPRCRARPTTTWHGPSWRRRALWCRRNVRPGPRRRLICSAKRRAWCGSRPGSRPHACASPRRPGSMSRRPNCCRRRIATSAVPIGCGPASAGRTRAGPSTTIRHCSRRSPPCGGPGGTDARAGAARLGDDAEQPRQRAPDARASGRAARRGWRRRSRPIARRCEERTRERVPLDWAMTQNNLGIALCRRLGSARAGRRGWRRRSRPIARRWRNGRASGCRSTGRRRRTTSATRSGRSASARAARRGWRRRSRPIARRWRNGRASACRSTGRRRRTTSATRFRRSASGRAARRGWRRRSRPIARRWRNGRASACRSTGR